MKLHNDEKLIILAIVVCIFVGLFGFSFAYYTAGAPGITGSGNGITGTTANNLNDVAFDAGSKLNLENAYPESKATKTFSVQINNSNPVSYTIKLNISENTFEKCTNDGNEKDTYKAGTNECEIGAKELVYTLKKGNTVIGTEKTDITNATGSITLYSETGKGDIDYTLEIEYVDTGKDQNHNMNKTFTGELKVEFGS